jgi:asparagine synthase (glutamine-hydrolysing)
MSGICGYIDYSRTIEEHVLADMVSSLAHRGPDDQGMKSFRTDKAKVALGHTQMAVIDIGADRQPMTFNGLTIVMDGEVYNFKEIRKELEAKGHCFLSNTDTEVVEHAFREWGHQCVDRFIGMFAFAIYDDTKHRLHLCRDRAGIKPLFYHLGNGFFAFASELKALMAMPQFKREVSMEALSAYI